MATKTKTAAKKTTTKKTATSKAATAKKTPAKPAAQKKPAAKKTTAKSGDKKMSALDAAAKVLGESKEPLNAKTMIERMAAKGYWTSPGGRTPHATLYAAIIREIQTKGKESRFLKADRGQFTLNK
ncbi:hypothetical protein Mal52_53670 [Symmachiella dynata]|uniref:HTH HARE-type domain-containing protein n=1 Tax=Symmachiella dynata TaxID=2527995 RepID=A0A517ZWK1_9PLAN|nr:winged helix-turn-helix domain-containing protein [Symmachiella dynata]QDU46844.1 hypothetical protein Mal52_53670 [Symmachiella dynata]